MNRSMGSQKWVESLESRQLFAAGIGDSSLIPSGSDRTPPQQMRPRGEQPPTGEQPPAGGGKDQTRVAPLAVYNGTITFAEESATKPFTLAILTELADGAVTAHIPGPRGPVAVAGQKSGNTYTLTATSDKGTATVIATIDVDGKVTGTLSRTYTEDGVVETETGTLALTKAEPKKKPLDPPIDNPTPDAKPIAVYQGTLTLADGAVRKFGLCILTEGADGAVTATIGLPGGPAKLTGTKTGNTYTLSFTSDKRTASLTATVDADGKVTGTVTTTITKPDGTMETTTGAIALTKVEPPAKPTKPAKPQVTTGTSTDATTKKTTTTTAVKSPTTVAVLKKTPVVEAKPARPAADAITGLTTYAGRMTIGQRSGSVVIRTYTDTSTGKTYIAIRSRGLLGKRTLLMEATINGNTISATRSDGERSATIALTTGADGSLAGTVTLTRGEAVRTMTIAAKKIVEV